MTQAVLLEEESIDFEKAIADDKSAAEGSNYVSSMEELGDMGSKNRICDKKIHPIESKGHRDFNRNPSWSNISMTGDLESNERKVDKSNAPIGSFLSRGHRAETHDLSWSNVNMTVSDKKGDTTKHILKDVWGSAKAGETTAIMGASGAGKTSLFNILAGRIFTRNNISVSADIRLGDKKFDPTNLNARALTAFVAQEDALHAPSTPRQALTFSAKLRLPRTKTDEEIKMLVDGLLEELGLSKCADTVIGGGLVKGISGGEKRRTSIGVELISQPSIIFLDEPTSGLDSFAAKQVMNLLEKVARAGNTVLFTIHQPSSKIFQSFDRLNLLHQGRLMFNDSTRTIAEDFGSLGYPIPKNYNAADWILDVAQSVDTEQLERTGFFPSPKSLPGDCKKLQVPKNHDHVSTLTELIMLCRREQISLTKNPLPMFISVGLTAFLSVIFGVIFWQIGTEDRADTLVVQAQVGALINILIATMMGQSQAALVVFTEEKPLFLREYSTDHYKIFPYFVSHLATEALQSFLSALVQALIVFWMIGFNMTFIQFMAVTFSLSMTATAVSVALGAMVSDTKVAASLFTLVVVPQFFFSGVFIAVELIPSWVRWAQYLCSLTYASRLAYVYEFNSCPSGLAEANCDRILEQNSVDEDSVWWYWLGLIGLFVLFRGMGMMILRDKGRTFS